MHSSALPGRPHPCDIIRHAIHRAAGAMPKRASAGSSPSTVPATWVPCAVSSHGSGESDTHAVAESWMASCQL